MTFQEYFVREMKLVPAVITVCETRVFHLEVFQNVPSNNRYPCVVYSLSDDDPEEELEENSGMLTANFSVIVICNDSTTLRSVAESIKSYFNNIVNIDAIYCETFGQIPWMSCKSDSEENIFASEQQEKGKRTTTLQVAMDHWQ